MVPGQRAGSGKVAAGFRSPGLWLVWSDGAAILWWIQRWAINVCG